MTAGGAGSPAAGAGQRRPVPCTAAHAGWWLVDGTVPGDVGLSAAASSDGARPGNAAWWATALGGARWVEHTLFEGVGRWAAGDPCPQAAALFGVLSLSFARHADLLADRLPVRAGVDPDALTASPAGWEELAGALVVPADDDSATGRRAALLARGVLPAMVVRYARWLAATGVSEAPVRAALRSVFQEERHAWLAVEALAQEHATPAVVAAPAPWRPTSQDHCAS